MKKILLVFLALSICGCDAPQRTRGANQFTNGNGLNGPNTDGSFGFSNGGVNSGTASGTGTVPAPAQSGFEACDFSLRFHSIDTGHFALCQSTADESILKIKTSVSFTTVKLCLIPTFKDSSGSSTYLGQPQCTFTEQNREVLGKLYKNRVGYENSQINGVIVMKELLLPQYYNCMNAFIQWPQGPCPQGQNSSAYCKGLAMDCPNGTQSSTYCHGQATNYMNQVCQAFKNNYANSYVDIRTK